MTDSSDVPQFDQEVVGVDSANENNSSKRTIRYLLIFGLLLVISILIFVFYLNVTQNQRTTIEPAAATDPVEAARGSASLVDMLGVNDDFVESDYSNSSINITYEEEFDSGVELDSRIDQLIDLVEQLNDRLLDIEANQQAIASSLVSHARNIESLVVRNEGADELTRSHFRLSNQMRESLRVLSEQVSQIDGSISSEFSRFPIFVWGPSSWGSQRFLTVSHMDSPRNTTDLVEGDSFHGWVLESAGSRKAVFRSGDRLHEVDL